MLYVKNQPSDAAVRDLHPAFRTAGRIVAIAGIVMIPGNVYRVPDQYEEGVRASGPFLGGLIVEVPPPAAVVRPMPELSIAEALTAIEACNDRIALDSCVAEEKATTKPRATVIMALERRIKGLGSKPPT